MPLLKTLALVLGTALVAAPALADAQKGFAIAERSDKTDEGYGASIAKLTMTLFNAAGASTTRELEIRTLEVNAPGLGDRSLTLFFTPRDVEGTALVSHAKTLESDDQWLFLPGLKRTKRISSSNKSGPFVGSEFSFEDLTINELEKYSYSFIETVQKDGMTMDVVEWVPQYERSGYTKLVGFYDQDVHQLREVHFFDRGGQHFKTLTNTEWRQYPNAWRPHRQEMVNHLTGKRTLLQYQSYDFSVSYDGDDFDPSVLRRL